MRQEKKTVVEEIKGMLHGKKMLILTDHTGLSSNQMNELRSLIKKSGSEYMVVKNRLLKRAFEEQTGRAFEAGLDGPTAIAVTSGDCAALSKIIVDFAKKNEAPKVKAGFLEGALLAATEVGSIAALPPRNVLLSRFIGGMQAPLSAFVRGLGELTRRFVYVMDQVAKGKSQIPNPKSQTSEGEGEIPNPPPKAPAQPTGGQGSLSAGSQEDDSGGQIPNPKSQTSEGE